MINLHILFQLSSSDWVLMENSMQILKIFMLTTKAAEGELSLLSDAIPFTKKLLLDVNSATDELKTFKEAAIYQINK